MKQNGKSVNRKGADALLWKLSKLGRLRFWYLATKVNVKILTAAFVLVACSISMVIMGVTAYFTSWPFIFPSLGPSTFLCFYSPSSPMASPRNMVLGHAIGAGVGFCVYKLSILLLPESISSSSMIMFLDPAIALGIAGMVMVITGILHPPAASTTMIAAMGLMPNWYETLVVVGAVAMIAAQGYIMHTLAGIRYPLWNPLEGDTHHITTILGNVVLERSKEQQEEEDPFSAVASQLAQRRKVKRKGD